MRPLEHFLIQFGIRRFTEKDEVLFVEDNKFYLISKDIANTIKKTKKPFYAGLYLGKARGKKFFPSVNLLNMMKRKSRNKIWVDKKAEWLFVCGRDLFAEGITRATHCVHKGIITLVMNKSDEVLGFGKAVKGLKEKDVVVKNIFDIGDFLRRERKIKTN
jgi:ribosome biogenesis protein Nip4